MNLPCLLGGKQFNLADWIYRVALKTPPRLGRKVRPEMMSGATASQT